MKRMVQGLMVLVLIIFLAVPLAAKSEKGEKNREHVLLPAPVKLEHKVDQQRDHLEIEDDDNGKPWQQEQRQLEKKQQKEQRKLTKQQQKQQRKLNDTKQMGKDGLEQRVPDGEEEPSGLLKQQQKKSEQVQKELGKGSEQGQKAREKRKKWYQFWQ